MKKKIILGFCAIFALVASLSFSPTGYIPNASAEEDSQKKPVECSTVNKGDNIKSNNWNSRAIWNVGSDNKIRPYLDGDDFKTWHTDNDYDNHFKLVTADCLASFQVANKFPVYINRRAGSGIIKTRGSEELYAVLPDNTKALITKEAAENLYGKNFPLREISLPSMLNYYNTAPEITGKNPDPHPGMVVEVKEKKYVVNSDKTLSEITEEGFKENGLKEVYVHEMEMEMIKNMKILEEEVKRQSQELIEYAQLSIEVEMEQIDNAPNIPSVAEEEAELDETNSEPTTDPNTTQQIPTTLDLKLDYIKTYDKQVLTGSERDVLVFKATASEREDIYITDLKFQATYLDSEMQGGIHYSVGNSLIKSVELLSDNKTAGKSTFKEALLYAEATWSDNNYIIKIPQGETVIITLKTKIGTDLNLPTHSTSPVGRKLELKLASLTAKGASTGKKPTVDTLAIKTKIQVVDTKPKLSLVNKSNWYSSNWGGNLKINAENLNGGENIELFSFKIQAQNNSEDVANNNLTLKYIDISFDLGGAIIDNLKLVSPTTYTPAPSSDCSSLGYVTTQQHKWRCYFTTENGLNLLDEGKTAYFYVYADVGFNNFSSNMLASIDYAGFGSDNGFVWQDSDTKIDISWLENEVTDTLNNRPLDGVILKFNAGTSLGSYYNVQPKVKSIVYFKEGGFSLTGRYRLTQEEKIYITFDKRIDPATIHSSLTPGSGSVNINACSGGSTPVKGTVQGSAVNGLFTLGLGDNYGDPSSLNRINIWGVGDLPAVLTDNNQYANLRYYKTFDTMVSLDDSGKVLSIKLGAPHLCGIYPGKTNYVSHSRNVVSDLYGKKLDYTNLADIALKNTSWVDTDPGVMNILKGVFEALTFEDPVETTIIEELDNSGNGVQMLETIGTIQF
ncbi:MAG: hypothetical protein ABIH87_02130 [bacterium]